MSKLKAFLAKEIEEYLRRVDFDVSKIEYIFNDISLDEIGLDELGLHENMNKYIKEMVKEMVSKIIEKIVHEANQRIYMMVDEVVDQIDSEQLSDTLSSGIEKKMLTFEPITHITEPICPTCYRMFGQWKATTGHTLTETEINKRGTRIVPIDDF